ncbi:MAG: cation:dicarboxylase symporter family transporter [Oscillospiraceae bacterium]|nr:cation:dicarboxylase symporter family transporter [Oscillospiraceae bacterium]
MKSKRTSILLNMRGVDEASEIINTWLSEAGKNPKDILRARLTMEELLAKICTHNGEEGEAELRLSAHLGHYNLRVLYAGDRYDPTDDDENEMEEWSSEILSRTGFQPSWRWRGGHNELVLSLPRAKVSSEFIMLACVVASVVVGLSGAYIPEGLKDALSTFVLSFLSDGFFNLLNTFIGLLIFFSIVTGICGIGSAASLSKIGKVMMTRFIGYSFLINAFSVLAARLCFHTGSGAAESGESQILEVMNMLFGILPSNPIKPFVDGNTLQIVFLAAFIGVILMFSGSRTEVLRAWTYQAQEVISKAVSLICALIPIYIFSSLVTQLWQNGSELFINLWKPLLFCIAVSIVFMAGYIILICWKLKVRVGVLIPKLLPGTIIGLTTASSSAAFATMLEINDKKMGIAPEISRTGVPIGSMLFAGTSAMLYVTTCIFLAEQHGVSTNVAWWITFWIMSTLITMATPPVAGGPVSCLSIMMMQMNIPMSGLAIGVALLMLIDFILTGVRIPCLQIELALQAYKLDMLDIDKLRQP